MAPPGGTKFNRVASSTSASARATKGASIMRPSTTKAPVLVACAVRAAASTLSAWAISASSGWNTSLASAIWLGWIQLFPKKPQAPRQGGFSSVAIGIADVGEGAVVGEDAGLTGGHAQGKHDLCNGLWLASRDSQGLEQIAQAQLQARHAGVCDCKLDRQTQGFGCLDIQQQANAGVSVGPEAVAAFCALDGVRHLDHILWPFGFGQVEQCQARLHNCLNVGGKVGANRKR